MKVLKKLFGGIDLTWKRLIIFALVMGAYTALVSLVPQVRETSFHSIAVTFEVWIFIGILIIMNSKSNVDSMLKCFVFFLISQPLVYLIQVPFSSLGWSLFGYYKYWFVWTILCLPMGYIGYYIKKDNWWGYLILLSMVVFTAVELIEYLAYFLFMKPYYLLTCVFCVVAMIIYPIAVFNNKRIRIVGVIVSVLLAVGVVIFRVMNPFVYEVDFLASIDGKNITADYQAYLADDKCGDLSVEYVESVESYFIRGVFKNSCNTELIVKTPEGTTKKYDVSVRWNTYDLTEKY